MNIPSTTAPVRVCDACDLPAVHTFVILDPLSDDVAEVVECQICGKDFSLTI